MHFTNDDMKNQIYKKDRNDYTNIYEMKECPLCGSLIDRKALFHDCEAFKRKKVNPV